MRRFILLALNLFLICFPFVLYGFNVQVETIDGETFSLKQFSMGGRKAFSVDQGGAIQRIDWNEIESFEIKSRGGDFWVYIKFVDGKRNEFSLRHYSPFQGRSELGTMLIPFEKVKRVSFLKDSTEEKKKEEPGIKESSLPWTAPLSLPDRVILRNGDILIGEVQISSLRIKTIYGTVAFKKGDISRLSYGKRLKNQKEGEKDVLISKYGDRLSGELIQGSIKLTLRNNTEIFIYRDNIQEIEFGIRPESEPKPASPIENK